jgi:alanyl-tRNA synthetase
MTMDTTQPTRKLYRTDSYVTTFEAHTLEVNTVNNRLEVRLDQTHFYPTAGGQANDTGRLEVSGNHFRVVDVRESKGEAMVTHVLEPVEPSRTPSLEVGTTVAGTIDWARRFDLMQQHTGEHILGQAFFRLNAHVMAVNMESTVCTIDLEETIHESVALEAERIANQAIWANHPVSCFELPEVEARSLPLRREPKVSGVIRVVQIGDYDYSACGGTHLRASGEVGMLKILKLERVKGGATRVFFICGERCLTDYRRKHAFVSDLGLRFSSALENVPKRTQAALEEANQLKREISNLRARYAETLVEGLQPNVRLSNTNVYAIELEDAAMLSDVVKVFAARTNAIGAVGARTPDKAMLAVTCGPGSGENANDLLKLALPQIDGRGGGKPDVAQGSGAKLEGLQHALNAILNALDPQMKR